MTAAMVATPADEARVRAAIDTMAVGLAGWDRQTPPADQSVLDDNTPTPVLPLAVYADGFGRIVRGDYSEVIDPRDAETHTTIGQIHLEAGRPTAAIPALRRALDLMPEQHEARCALAIALKQTGHADEAARELQLFERGRV